MQPQAILLEPVGRNTAPAVAVAAMAAVADLPRRQGACDPVLLVLPADHVIRDVQAFQAAVAVGREAAAAGQARHVRRRADQARDRLRLHPPRRRRRPGAIRSQQFVEKPDCATRSATSIRRVFLEQRHVHVPRQRRARRAARARAARSTRRARRRSRRRSAISISRACRPRSSPRVRSDSFDYAVMEKTQHGVVVPLDAGWSDVGSWSALHEAIPARRATATCASATC